MKNVMRKCLLAFMLVPALASAGSWWNNDWKFRKEISFDLSTASADVANSVDDVPVLVRLSSGNFGYFADVKADGSDFRFVAGDDKTPLKFHVERFDATNQMAFLWVQVPKLVGGSKTDKIFLYYGNPDAQAAGDAATTYDADQSLVLHFGGEGMPLDATAYKNNVAESTAETAPASFSAAGLKFTGKESAKVAASPSLEITAKGATLSVWVRYDAAQGSATVVSATDGSREIALGVQGLRPVARVLGTTISATADAPAGAWHHLAVTVGGGKAILYVDGMAVGNAPATLTNMNAAVVLGNGFAGELDEVEVSRTVRTPDWVKASVKAQGPDGNLVSYGADGQKEGGGGSYIGIIAKNLTADGWVVIGICFFMLLVAAVLMVMKAFYLSRVEKANAAFLETYSKIAGDVTVIPTGREGTASPDAAWASSTLFRLYATGMDELFKRIVPGKSSVEGVYLSEQSIEAIRASIDAASTRMQQQLAARMVLLTIAISGGPFLGLLGTVVGVMITFAAIAAAGDVNVNAIAPGVAAALAATVAGLLVAIPSLFGYNWLNTRIKAVGADNRVFADEVIARLAEQHSGER